MTRPERLDRPSRSRAEWVAFGIACALLSVVVGAIGLTWVTDDGRPARIDVTRIGTPRADGGNFYVLVEVANRGERTAESVQVVAELSLDGEVLEEGEQTIDFLSGDEVEEIQFIFTTDPASAELSVRAASFAKP